MSLTQGGGQLPAPGILPAFQNDVNYMTNFANSLQGLQAPTGAFTPTAGQTGAANVGNNYFGAGGAGQLGISQLSNILSGNNLNPASNPYLQSNIGAMQQAFGKTLGSATDQLNAQFAGSGQYGGDSGARNNALTQLGTNSLQNFGNSLTSFLGSNYQQGQNQITSALGDLNQPLSAASNAFSLAGQPGQEQVAGQQYGLNLSELPFNLLQQVMQSAPVYQPSYAPSQPSDLAGWLNFALQGAGAGAQAYSGAKIGGGLQDLAGALG
jgi:hypothetical protein